MQSLLRTDRASPEGRQFAIRTVINWAAEKWPELIPQHARDGKDFEHDQPGLEIGAVDVPEQGLWGFRVEHLDADIPGRAWLVEAVVAAADEGFDVLGVRSQCTVNEAGEVPATSPRFLKSWLERLCILDSHTQVSTAVVQADSVEAIGMLAALITHVDRKLPVVVVSEHADGTWPIEAERLGRRTGGLAHIRRLKNAQTFALSQFLGKDLSVFNGAVRTYWPGFGHAQDSQSHFNVLPGRIKTWRASDGEGAGAFIEYLVEQMHRYSVSTPARLEQLPSFTQLQRIKAERERSQQIALIETLQKRAEGSGAPQASVELEVLKAQLAEKTLELEIASLDTQAAVKTAADADALFNEQATDLAAAQEEREALRAANLNLLAGIKRLKAARADVDPPPTAYEEIPDWVDQTLSDRVILLGRARRSLKEAMFQDVALVVKCIQLLADEYWAMRTADHDLAAAAKLRFETKMLELGIDEAPSISSTSMGRFEEQYRVNYQIGQKSRQTLERHLRGGSNFKDDHYCLRIYFFWDDEKQIIVVGHLPGHLDTQAT